MTATQVLQVADEVVVRSGPSFVAWHIGQPSSVSITGADPLIGLKNDRTNRQIVTAQNFAEYRDTANVAHTSYANAYAQITAAVTPVFPMTSRYAMWQPNSGTLVSSQGIPRTAVGTTANPTIATTNKRTIERRWSVTSAATTNSVASEYSTQLSVARGVDLGGFRYLAQFGMSTIPALTRTFFGLSSSTGAFSTTQDPQALTNVIGIGFNQGVDTNWQILHNDGSGVCTKVDLGASFLASSTSSLLTLRIICPPSGSVVVVEVTDIVSGVAVARRLSTDLPATTQALGVRSYANNGGTVAACAYECTGVVVY